MCINRGDGLRKVPILERQRWVGIKELSLGILMLKSRRKQVADVKIHK